MNKDTLIQVLESSTKCRILELDATKDFFREQALPDYPNAARKWTNLCKTSDKQVFLIGGSNETSCLRFDMKIKLWENMPNLQQPRYYCSSCVLAGNLYVFGGHNHDEGL